MLCLKWHKAVYNSIYYIFLKLSNIKYKPPKEKKNLFVLREIRMHSHRKKKLHMPLNYHFLRHFFVLQRYSLPSSSDLTPKNDVTKFKMQSNRLKAGAVQGCQLYQPRVAPQCKNPSGFPAAQGNRRLFSIQMRP